MKLFPVETTLLQLYDINDPSALMPILQATPELYTVLAEAHRALHRIFGPAITLNLALVADPDANDLEKIWGTIGTTLTPDEALDRLTEFDKAFYLKLSVNVRRKLNFDIDCL